MHIVLLAFALGVLALQQQPSLPPVWWAWVGALPLAAASAAALLARSASGWRRQTARVVALFAVAVAVSIFGFFYAAWRAELRLADELPSAWEGRDVDIVGVIDELPQPTDRGTRFAFAVERSLTPGAIVPSRLSLAWYSGWSARSGDGASEDVPDLHAGERWQITVRLKRPHGTVNPHGFDVEAWLLENELRATGYVRKSDDNRRVDAFAGRPGDYVARARESIRTRILSALGERPYSGVIAALAIGDERAIPNEQWQMFNRTGIGHLISISGLHVTFFATLIAAVVFWLWRKSHRLTLRLPARKAAAVAAVLAAFAYVLLAGFQVPAQRTLYMLTVAAIGLWLGRPGTASVVWLWALAVVLAYDPWAMLSPGFWLSFGAVGLLLYTGVGRLGPGSAVGAAVRAQWAITLGLIPLMLILFQQISIVSPFANAVAIPVVTFVVVPLTLASIAVPWDVLLVIAHQVFAWVAALLDFLSGLPGAVWQQHAPPVWAVIAGALGVLWLLAPRGVPGRALGFVWLLPLFVVVPLLPPPGAFRVIVLDVGQGLAVLVQTHAHALLYDAGPRFNDSADAGNRIIAPLLRAAGIARLDGLIVSHQDTDHSGGALSLMQTVPIGWLASSLPEDHEIVQARLASGESMQRCESGRRWTWDGVEFALLHPVVANYANPKLKANDLSCVVRVGNATGRALLTGDIEARTEADLIRRDAQALRAELLIVPHHGSRTSSTPAFIAAVQPEVAVFTPGYRNRYGHPRPEIVERYLSSGIRSWRTDYDGALTFEFAPGAKVGPRSEREYDRRYWRDAPNRGALAPLDGFDRHAMPASMIRVLAATTILALATPSGAQDRPKEGARELKLSTALGPAYPQGKAGEAWARLINERSGGRIAVRHAPGAMLVQRDPAREFAALRAGAIDLAVGSTLVWSAQVKEINLIGLPWLVPDEPALAALLSGDVGARLLAHIEAAGVVPIELAANAFLELATNSPVHAPRDLAGLRIRLQPASPLLTDTLTALGALPAAMAYADAQAALSSGTLAGQETSVAAYAASRQYAAGLNYLQLWGAHADALVFAVNRAVWQRFSDDDRQLVRQAAREAAMQAATLSRNLNEPAALARLGRDGAVVTRLTAAGKRVFKSAVQPMYERWAEVVGVDLVRAAEAAVASPR